MKERVKKMTTQRRDEEKERRDLQVNKNNVLYSTLPFAMYINIFSAFCEIIMNN